MFEINDARLMHVSFLFNLFIKGLICYDFRSVLKCSNTRSGWYWFWGHDLKISDVKMKTLTKIEETLSLENFSSDLICMSTVNFDLFNFLNISMSRPQNK